ncbi:hypothetical protein HXX76_008985 [Chlamydomonas incerta]|uniref:MYND-type domain-containing protein n=1 Tax=Chlamydomonas incerta TaxID=51695 RepID=A0A835T550_CHLIN|nr:hypothetical protein HXX76_008985 [Chlamydomonas incerta]|eukprot:KAG2432645.1 hypothetical protein HXX76_008985 [Chlamydomonas incerta]
MTPVRVMNSVPSEARQVVAKLSAALPAALAAYGGSKRPEQSVLDSIVACSITLEPWTSHPAADPVATLVLASGFFPCLLQAFAAQAASSAGSGVLDLASSRLPPRRPGPAGLAGGLLAASGAAASATGCCLDAACATAQRDLPVLQAATFILNMRLQGACGTDAPLPPRAAQLVAARSSVAVLRCQLFRAHSRLAAAAESAVQNDHFSSRPSLLFSDDSDKPYRDGDGPYQAIAKQHDDMMGLLLAELAASRFLEHSAALVLTQAAAQGRRDQAVRCGRMGEAEAEEADARRERSNALHFSMAGMAKSAAQLMSRRRTYISSMHGGLTAAAITALGAEARTAAGSGVAPPPQLWGVGMHTLMLAEVVAGLVAAGFGGGVRGTWGLPPELVAGLPVLGLDAREAEFDFGPLPLRQEVITSSNVRGCSCGSSSSSSKKRGALVVMRLNPAPFHTLACLLDEHLFVAELPDVGAAAAAEAEARAPLRLAGLAAPGYPGRPAGVAAVAAAGRMAAAGGEQQPRWRLPVGRRALAALCLRIVDLAAAGYTPPPPPPAAAKPKQQQAKPQPPAEQAGSKPKPKAALLGTTSASAASAAGAAPAAAATALVRMRPCDVWMAGAQGLSNARRLLALSPEAAGEQPPAAATAAAATRRSSHTAVVGRSGGDDHGGSGCGGGYQLLPAAWWRAFAALLHSPEPLRVLYNDAADAATICLSGTREVPPSRQPCAWLQSALTLERMPDPRLALQPPPSLDVAIRCGYVPAGGHGGALGCSWPLLQQLLAFAPLAASAALVTSLGKRLQLALDQAEEEEAVAAVSGGGSGSSSWFLAADGTVTRPLLELARSVAAALPQMEHVGFNAGSSSSGSSSRPADGYSWEQFCGDKSELTSWPAAEAAAAANNEAAAQVKLERWQRLQRRRLLSYTLTRWLPALARYARRLPGAELASMVQAQLRQPPARQDWKELQRYLSAAEAGLSSLGGSAAIAAAERAAWRQFLLRDVDVVGVLGAAIRTAAELLLTWQCRLPIATAAAVHSFLPQLLTLLQATCAVAPEALAAAMQQPQPRQPSWSTGLPSPCWPWDPQILRVLCLTDAQWRHTLAAPGGGADAAVAEVRAFAAAHGVAAVHGGFRGGPLARMLAHQPRGCRSFFAPLSPLVLVLVAQQVEAVQLAPHEEREAGGREQVAAGPGGSSGSHRGAAGDGGNSTTGSGSTSSGSGTAGVTGAGGGAVPPGPPRLPLRCCANPRCTNLAASVGADSDADLPLLSCSGCRGTVAYCSKGCQAAHWRAGHREACTALRGWQQA